MANEQNLNKKGFFKANDKATIEAAIKGGKASGETRRLKAAVKRALLGAIPKEMNDLRELLENEGIDMTNDNGIAFAMVLKALKGDKSAADWVRDTSGEKLKDEIKVGGEAVVIISGDDKIAE